jgi:hypothetical protein
VPPIKFWVDGLETVDARDERPLGDAERAELERQAHVSKWLKLLERVTGATAALGACMALFSGNRVIRHKYDLAVVACGALALAARFVASRRA